MAGEILESQGSQPSLVGSPGPQERGNRVHTPAGPRDTGHVSSVSASISSSVKQENVASFVKFWEMAVQACVCGSEHTVAAE